MYQGQVLWIVSCVLCRVPCAVSERASLHSCTEYFSASERINELLRPLREGLVHVLSQRGSTAGLRDDYRLFRCECSAPPNEFLECQAPIVTPDYSHLTIENEEFAYELLVEPDNEKTSLFA